MLGKPDPAVGKMRRLGVSLLRFRLRNTDDSPSRLPAHGARATVGRRRRDRLIPAGTLRATSLRARTAYGLPATQYPQTAAAAGRARATAGLGGSSSRATQRA